MRKRILFAFVLSLCVVDFGVLAATRQGSVTAGTKVAAATENTVIPLECQNAYNGCMDSFCMLDNASGGRCQCSDKITELDQALDDIVKLDEQTYLMATEGVDRIQLGEAEAQVVSRANAARDKVVSDDSAKKRKTRTSLDLSAWNSVAFIDDGSVFDDVDSSEIVTSFANKKGDALHKASASMCASQLSTQCKSYSSMLQLVYAQKIKSDCVAYENSLKIQKNQSQQKLQTAQRALRDAALEEYQNQNKYATLGECVIAFTQCMQTTAECGTNYQGCVSLAARENLRNNKSGARAKQKKIKGAVSGADITLAASTMNQLLAKKPMCESVTKQCVNVNKNDAVWESFLRNAAPSLKSAELIAEQDLRANCIPTLAECFKTACRDEFRDEASYDACLSNPETYKSLCKVQLEPCLEATGGSYAKPTESSLWNTLVAFLNAMKVDACTAQVKSCLEERCGNDYAECIGLDTESVGNLCPYQKLTACMTENKDEDTVREYVAEVAMGLAMQIDNALIAACQNAADDAMVRVCGDTQSCDAAQIDLSSLKYMITPMACRYSDPQGNDRQCYQNLAQFGNTDNGCGIFATLTGKPAVSAVIYDGDRFDSVSASYFTPEFNTDSTNQVVSILNSALDRIMNSIEVDPKVVYCMSGRRIEGFYGFDQYDIDSRVRFSNLTKSIRTVVADHLLSLLYEKNEELEDSFEDAMDDLNDKIAVRLSDSAYASSCFGGTNSSGSSTSTQSGSTQVSAAELARDKTNRLLCTCDKTQHYSSDEKPNQLCLTETDMYRWRTRGGDWIVHKDKWAGSKKTVTDKIGIYDDEMNTCTIQKIRYECIDWKSLAPSRCREYGEGVVLSEEQKCMIGGCVNGGKKPR